MRKFTKVSICMLAASMVFVSQALAFELSFKKDPTEKKKQLEQTSKAFTWWPTDAKPGPVKDSQRSGYWWWPTTPGKIKPWGNRGYVYVYKIIYDYKAEELPAPKPEELRPSLLIKKILTNVKIYYDYNKADIREDAVPILDKAIKTLKGNPETDILITGNCDARGSEIYNQKLGRKRADSVKKYMIDSGIAETRIRIISRGKLDAVAPIKDLVGMQKDRNAQFMVAQVEEVMIPNAGRPESPNARMVGENKYVEEVKGKVEGEVKVTTKEYIVQKGDTLAKIAQKECGGAHRWKYLYEFNKDRIKDPNKLKAGQKILIPVE